MVVFLSLSRAKQLCLRECRKNLARQQLVAQSGVETFNDPVLPRRAWLALQRVGFAFLAPALDHIGDKFRSVVAANIFRCPASCSQLVSTRITSCEFSLRDTSSARFSRVHSFSTTNILIGLPFAVWSKIKSMPHAWFLRIACLRRMPDCADPILRFFCGFVALSDLLLAKHDEVVCDLHANLHDPTSLACAASHGSDACARVRAAAMRGVFGMCS